MEGGSLFNPGFLGANFLWWVGQVADDSTWRENLKESKHKSSSEVPGWGYRYKVRIIGLHDKEEEIIPSDQLPWAQVMYPITAGGGQGSSYQTPAIKQGMFVFGFFLDGQDQQVPVIMGVLGANPQIQKTPKTAVNGGENYTSQSGHGNQSPDATKKVKDNDLATERPSGTSQSGTPTGGNNPANPPTPNAVPTKESPAAPHQQTAGDKKKDRVLKRKHTLLCPDPNKSSPLKAIQTEIEKVTQEIEKIQKSIQDYESAISAGLSIIDSAISAINQINRMLKDAACQIAKFLQTIYQLIQDFITDLYTKILQPLFKLTPPSTRIKWLEKLIKGLEIISCIFNKIGLSLCDSAEKALRGSLKKRSQQSPPPPEYADRFPDIPWLVRDNYYNPTPVCSVEELVGGVLGENLNDIVQGFDAAISPIVADIQNNLAGVGVNDGGAQAQSSNLITPLNLGSLNVSGLLNTGSLGGGGFDIGAALGFVSAITSFFSCDILPKCSANDTHTLQEGGSGKPGTDEPNSIAVAQIAQEKFLAQATGGGTLTGAGTAAEGTYVLPNDVA